MRTNTFREHGPNANRQEPFRFYESGHVTITIKTCDIHQGGPCCEREKEDVDSQEFPFLLFLFAVCDWVPLSVREKKEYWELLA